MRINDVSRRDDITQSVHLPLLSNAKTNDQPTLAMPQGLYTRVDPVQLSYHLSKLSEMENLLRQMSQGGTSRFL